MARLFRFYEKKRGDRRTGPEKLGSIGEALFFAVFLCVGCAASVLMLWTLVIPEFRANRHFVATTCTVLAKDVAESSSDSGYLYRPEITIRFQAQRPEPYERVTYDVTHTGFAEREQAEAVLDGFEIGQQYPCWYDPMDPSQAVLVRGYSGWLYLKLLIPISFMFIGGGGLIYTMKRWDTSVERRATLAQRAAQVDLFELAAGNNNDYPHVPRDTNLRNSPGTTLAYRLPIASAPGWRLLAAVMACLLWNAFLSPFAFLAIESFVDGEPNWMLAALVIPFMVIGAGLIYYLVREVVAANGVGSTRLEISDHPLRPGEQYEVLVTQAGRLNVQSLEILLVCDEKATYRQGTDARTESARVYEERVFMREGFEILPGLPFSDQCRIRVPQFAMHSFKGDHNEINWKLVIRGNVARWPSYERVFPVIVYPAPGSLEA